MGYAQQAPAACDLPVTTPPSSSTNPLVSLFERPSPRPTLSPGVSLAKADPRLLVQNNLLKLLRNVVDPQLGGEIRKDRDEVTETQEALDRLHNNEYHLIDVDGFQARNAARQLKRKAAKKEFEVRLHGETACAGAAAAAWCSMVGGGLRKDAALQHTLLRRPIHTSTHTPSVRRDWPWCHCVFSK